VTASVELRAIDVPVLEQQRARFGRPPIVVMLAACVLLALVVISLAGPSLLVDPNAQDLSHTLQPPFWMHGGTTHHLFGTDTLGRDLLSRTVTGLRSSLFVCLIALLIGGVVGTAVGMLSGFAGGVVDDVLMRLIDVQLAIPDIVLVILIVAVLKPSTTTIAAVLALSTWIVFARVARVQTLTLREQDMVVAMRVMGASPTRIMVRHVFPNIGGPLIVIATIRVSALFLTLAGLGYLGLGAPPPAANLGSMISDEQTSLIAGIWWPVVVPAVCIVLVIACFNTIGEWLRHVWDPRAALGR
jgi:peptide/nickel transport system permease protein